MNASGVCQAYEGAHVPVFHACVNGYAPLRDGRVYDYDARLHGCVGAHAQLHREHECVRAFHMLQSMYPTP